MVVSLTALNPLGGSDRGTLCLLICLYFVWNYCQEESIMRLTLFNGHLFLSTEKVLTFPTFSLPMISPYLLKYIKLTIKLSLTPSIVSVPILAIGLISKNLRLFSPITTLLLLSKSCPIFLVLKLALPLGNIWDFPCSIPLWRVLTLNLAWQHE